MQNATSFCLDDLWTSHLRSGCDKPAFLGGCMVDHQVYKSLKRHDVAGSIGFHRCDGGDDNRCPVEAGALRHEWLVGQRKTNHGSRWINGRGILKPLYRCRRLRHRHGSELSTRGELRLTPLGSNVRRTDGERPELTVAAAAS